MAAVSAHGSMVCVLMRSLELFVQPLDGVGGSFAFPLAGRKRGEGEEVVARFLEAVGDGRMA